MSHVYDVVATVGTYESNGERKFISRNVGRVIQTKKGLRMKLDAYFNPAGCPREDDGSIWLAFFEPKQQGQQQQRAAPQQQRTQQRQQAPAGSFDGFDDDPGF